MKNLEEIATDQVMDKADFLRNDIMHFYKRIGIDKEMQKDEILNYLIIRIAYLETKIEAL
jgi:hypothetical protein